MSAVALPERALTRERPILFSGTMVRAILAGQKTQTRRVMKLREFGRSDTRGYEWTFRDTRMCWNDVSTARLVEKWSPYGATGDLLIVKEAAWMWCEKRPNGTSKKGRPKFLYVPLESAPVLYCADHPDKPGTSVVSPETGNPWAWRNKLGRFLPRWASRITLEVISVRVERLQEISEEDARAEGVERIVGGGSPLYPSKQSARGDSTHREAFQKLWQAINGKRPGCSWADSPWVWVVSFRKVPPAVLDQLGRAV